MKKSWSIIAIAAALSASSAFAVTPAGTKINNEATLIFTPEGSKTPEKEKSNTVTTVVLPQPSFSITPNDKGTDVSTPDYTGPAHPAQPVKPCDKDVNFLYTLTNTGNLNGESYTLSDTPDPTGTVKTPDNIRYYAKAADTDKDNKLSPAEIKAAQPITSISGVKIGEAVQFFVVYDVPCSATGTEDYGSSPTGERNDNPSTPDDDNIKLPKDANNSNKVNVVRKDGVVIGPKNDANADNKEDGKTDPNKEYASPEGVKVYPGGVTLDGKPVPNDDQVAVVTTRKGDTVVTFTNTVQNTGNRDDVFKITVKTPQDFPANSKVEVFKDDKATTPLKETDKLAPGKSQSVYVRVTIPAATKPSDLAKDPVVDVIATSTNDPKKSDPTQDIIRFKLPGVAFGDPDPSVGGDPKPVGTPPTGTLGSPDSPVDTSKCVNNQPIRTYLPMEVGNIGSVVDSYDISGTAPVKVLKPDGTVDPKAKVVNVIYFKDANGNGKLDAGEDKSPITNTGPIQPGKEVKLIAVVDVPCGAIAQDIILDQTAKSPTTGTTGKDTNDKVTVGADPDVGKPVKTVDKKKAKPGEVLTYTVTAKNGSNANVKNAYICDAVPEYTDFVSFSATSSASKSIYYAKLAKGADVVTAAKSWSKAPVSGVTNGGKGTKGGIVCAAPDINGDGKIDAKDLLAPGQNIIVTFKVKIQ